MQMHYVTRLIYLFNVNTKTLSTTFHLNNNYRNLSFGLAKVRAKIEARESHLMLLGVQESVRE